MGLPLSWCVGDSPMDPGWAVGNIVMDWGPRTANAGPSKAHIALFVESLAFALGSRGSQTPLVRQPLLRDLRCVVEDRGRNQGHLACPGESQWVGPPRTAAPLLSTTKARRARRPSWGCRFVRFQSDRARQPHPNRAMGLGRWDTPAVPVGRPTAPTPQSAHRTRRGPASRPPSPEISPPGPR